MNCVLWLGPVYGPGTSPYPAGDIGRVNWGTPTQVVTLSGDGSSHFSGLAAQYRDTGGHILPNLLASQGYAISDFDKIGCAGFSAAHGLMDPLLGADGDSIAGAVSLDACFELAPPGAPKAGYAAYSARAARGEKLMVFTGSMGQNAPPLPPTTKGYECAFHAADAGALAAGATLVQVETPAGMTTPACGAWNAGGLWVFSYCDKLHGDLINKLGDEALQTLLAPALLGDIPSEASAGRPWWQWALAAGVLAAVAGTGIALAEKRS